MSNQEKKNRLKAVAQRIIDDKKVIDEKGVQKASQENGIKFSTLFLSVITRRKNPFLSDLLNALPDVAQTYK